MIPSPWIGVVLVFAAYRLTRLVGWDDFPPVAKARAWLLGERWITPQQRIARAFKVAPALAGQPEESRKPPAALSQPVSDADPELPGKTPDSPVQDLRVAYNRPLLAHLVHCPFCLGWWISVAVYAAWLVVPSATMYAAVPLAVAGAVGLISKNLDA